MEIRSIRASGRAPTRLVTRRESVRGSGRRALSRFSARRAGREEKSGKPFSILLDGHRLPREHGKRDRIIPSSNARTVTSRATGRRSFLGTTGAATARQQGGECGMGLLPGRAATPDG